MNVKIGNTSKRINSTSQTFASSTTLSCKLKEPCSMQSPIFMVQGLTKGSLYNYCEFESRYYWVDDIVYLTNNIQEVHCHLDPLATYKSAIENTYAYVTYGDSTHCNYLVDDIRFGPDFKDMLNTSTQKGTLDIGFNRTDWSVIMTINCCTSLTTNGVLTYAMSYADFKKLLNQLQSDIVTKYGNLQTLDDVIMDFATDVLTGGAAAVDNIKSAIAVPVPLASVVSDDILNPPTPETYVGCGAYQVNVSSLLVYTVPPTRCIKPPVTTISLVRGGAGSANNVLKWLNSPKYCSIKVSHPGGYSDINDPSLMRADNIYVYPTITPCTGDYVLRFTSELGEDSDTIAMMGGNVAVDLMSLINNANSTIGAEMLKAVGTGAVSVASSIVATKTAAKSANTTLDVTNDAGDVIGQVKMPKTQVNTQSISSGVEGSYNSGNWGPSHSGASLSSGFCGIGTMPNSGMLCYDIEYYYPNIFPPATISSADYISFCDEYGYPCNKYLKIGDVAGYCECAGASVKGATGASEASKSTINSYLNSGLYIE